MIQISKYQLCILEKAANVNTEMCLLFTFPGDEAYDTPEQYDDHNEEFLNHAKLVVQGLAIDASKTATSRQAKMIRETYAHREIYFIRLTAATKAMFQATPERRVQ
jgi:hypothetical protein